MNALKWALDNVTVKSADDGGSLVILHVQSPPSIATGLNPGSIPFGGPSMEVPAFAAAIEAHQKRITDAIINHALEIASQKDVNIKTHVVIGDPKEKICEVVDEMHADLLVMENRAFGPIKRMFLGSVSKYCSNHASCPVVIVKKQEFEEILRGCRVSVGGECSDETAQRRVMVVVHRGRLSDVYFIYGLHWIASLKIYGFVQDNRAGDKVVAREEDRKRRSTMS